jgi:hypothetical protein
VRLPPDLLWLEWFQGKREAAPYVQGRFLAVYKYNLFDHIGTVSSFTVRPNRPKWPGCFDNMSRAYVVGVPPHAMWRSAAPTSRPCRSGLRIRRLVRVIHASDA